MSTLTRGPFAPSRTPEVPVRQVWHTTSEAAAYCRMSTKQLLRYATSGRLEGEQLVSGGHWRFHIDQLDAFLRSR